VANVGSVVGATPCVQYWTETGETGFVVYVILTARDTPVSPSLLHLDLTLDSPPVFSYSEPSGSSSPLGGSCSTHSFLIAFLRLWMRLHLDCLIQLIHLPLGLPCHM